MIRNSELAGLTDNEIELIAQIARYHRKSEPKQSHPRFAALSRGDQRLVRSLAGVLRVAIGLDRRHDGRVADSRSTSGRTAGRLVVTAIAADGNDIGLEVFAAGERSSLLARVLERDVSVVACGAARRGPPAPAAGPSERVDVVVGPQSSAAVGGCQSAATSGPLSVATSEPAWPAVRSVGATVVDGAVVEVVVVV